MNIVNNFRDHLFTDKSKPSKVTVKNYLSDVRKFLQWYEKAHAIPFSPDALSPEIIRSFQTALTQNGPDASIAARSAKRYISSLRKFCRFLKDSGTIEANPFEAMIDAPKALEDPWQVKAFKNSLVTHGASKLTIKNYLHDTQQFLAWLEKVTENTAATEEQRFLHIDGLAVQKYKDRLMTEANFSSTSINRKLSSLRRYIRWLSESGYVAKPALVKEQKTPEAPVAPVIAVPVAPLPLTALRQLAKEEAIKNANSYSSFAPIRLAQKTQNAINKGVDLLILEPIVSASEAIQYSFWKKSKRQIFAPVKTILDGTTEVLPVISEVAATPKTAITISKFTTKTLSLVNGIVKIQSNAKPYTIRNISKSFYAPLSISLTHLPWHERMIHHIKHTRPAWYLKYHTYPISHHIHVAIMIFATAVAAFSTYQVAVGNQNTNSAAIAAQPVAPPRTLSFQGRLLDKTNTPITAPTNLRFAIYTSPAATGSAMVWQEPQEITPNQDGYFTTLLGKKASLTQQLLSSNPNLYVGISVGTNNELQPRQQLATGGYASNAQSLQGLKPITQTDAIQNVILALDSSGDLTIGGTASPKFQATGGQFTLSGQSLLLTTNPGSNGNIELTPDGSGIIDMQGPLQNTTNNNTVTGVPGAVEVADLFAIVATSSGQSALTVRQNSTGDIISGFSGNIARFKVDGGGAGMFAGSLTINGNTITSNATSFGIANTNVINLSIGNAATSLSLGASSGVTTINNNLDVRGSTKLNGPVSTNDLLTANGGITVASGKKITLTDFTPGAIPFIGANNELMQEGASFNWTTANKALNITGALCIKSTAGVCAGAAAGTIYASNATVQAADLAENYISSQQLEAGDVVIPESLGNNLAIVKSTAPYQQQVIGIISTKPGFTLNSDAKGDAEHPNVYPLALQGRVPVKVSTMNGAIKSGDPLTSSPIPGVAMKATQTGQIIARALEDYAASDPMTIGKVTAFVNISYQVPQSHLTDAGDLSLAIASGIATVSEEEKTLEQPPTLAAANGIIDGIKSTLLEATQISTETLTVTTNNFVLNGMQIDDYISGIVQEITGTNAASSKSSTDIVNSLDNKDSDFAKLAVIEPNATSSASTANIATKSATVADPIVPVAVASSASGSFDSIYNSIGTISAAPTIITPAPTQAPIPQSSASADLIGSEVDALLAETPTNFMDTLQTPSELGLEKLDTKEITVSNTLSVLGRTTLSDVGITGKVTIGLMSIEGLNDAGTASINTSAGPLMIQSNGFNGVDFLNGKVAIDTSGNLKVNGNAFFAKDVTVKGKLAANIIAPVPGSDLTVQNNNGASVVSVNQRGDVSASGAGKFANINIIRGAQADTSITETNANGSAGKGVIKAKQKERTIFTPYVHTQSLIYVTATSDTQKMSLYVARQKANDPSNGTKGSFTMQIPTSVNKDISFNWWIVN
ncbi:MAG: site-specific integrase [Candidatus Levybacteria bacterium]|nr:site-specific integrase [Candidatus Levybacteria bacterium]